MKNIKKKIQNGLVGTLVFGGMALFGGSPLTGAYLHHIRPKKPEIVSEYRGLKQEYTYLTSRKNFTLKEILNQEYIQEQKNKADFLSEQIKSIESPENYVKISKYEEEKRKQDKYWIIPFLQIIIGASSMLYGVHLESKINSPVTPK